MVTLTVGPSTVRWAVRGVPVVLAVKEKGTTPSAAGPTVSQLWSLVGAKGPVSGWEAGSTGGRASVPAAGPSLTAPPGTNARGSSSIALLLVSAMKTLPAPSTATPSGRFNPETRVE